MEFQPSPKHKLPENTAVFAIGDIHGRKDLLEKIHQKIAYECIGLKADNVSVVYLGDYIDRGAESKEVIDLLINKPLEGVKNVYLSGNHEQALLNFIKNPEDWKAWLLWGGRETALSYGVAPEAVEEDDFEEIAEQLKVNIPEGHMDFLNEKLSLYYSLGDYLFVHAGLEPKIGIDFQDAWRMMTIRDSFVKSDYDFGKMVIFGHTVFDTPHIDSNKIGIDTGAYGSGKLTSIMIIGDKYKFIET